MPVQVFRHLKDKTSQMAYSSALYNWSLSGDVPDRLVVRPVDPWPGKAEHGRIVCGEACAIEGDQLDIEVQARVGADRRLSFNGEYPAAMHDFTWLRDLRALGNAAARSQARAMIEEWAQHYHKWDAVAWKPGVMGERLSMWIALYEFFGSHLSDAAADARFQDVFFDSAIRQARHLARGAVSEVHGLDALKALKGLLYAGLAFEGHEEWVEQALGGLEAEITQQVLGDGAHISRSPSQLLSALQVFLDVKTALTSGGYPLPETIQHAIDKMGPALRFFRYADKHFGLFNGAQEGDESFIDCVLGQANVRGKGLQSLPCAGYERLSQGRTAVLFDGGASPAYPHDTTAHAAPLAFEMSYGKDRIFVSCGTHPTSAGWQDALRATAAHSAATIDHRNACEIREDGHFARKVKHAIPVREDSKDAILVESSHDGYVPLNGITHGRRLFLSNKGHDLRGEDSFRSQIPLTEPKEIVIRFHIHPRVNVSLVKDGQEALLRLSSGIGWRFKQTGGYVLALEDSIYLGSGIRPRKTKQLAIYGQITDNECKFKWAMQHEG